MIKTSKLKKGIHNPEKVYRYLRSKPLHSLENLYLFTTSRHPIGTHVLERDWDVLVILDTCRVDALRYVASEYNFLSKDKIGMIWSLGGTSPEWIAHTFDAKYKDELTSTGYVTANPHAKTVLEDRSYKSEEHSSAALRFYRYGNWNPVRANELSYYDPLYSYQSDILLDGVERFEGVTPPRYVTDRAIATARKHNLDRLVLHYMQPHYPWVANAIREGREIKDFEKRPSKAKSVGKKVVFNAYLDDLRYVLDEVELLLKNLNADKVVISADHGDAFGEWGVYGHDPGRFHPKVRYVPWAKVSGIDKGKYEPQIEVLGGSSNSTIEQLEALGYK